MSHLLRLKLLYKSYLSRDSIIKEKKQELKELMTPHKVDYEEIVETMKRNELLCCSADGHTFAIKPKLRKKTATAKVVMEIARHIMPPEQYERLCNAVAEFQMNNSLEVILLDVKADNNAQPTQIIPETEDDAEQTCTDIYG